MYVHGQTPSIQWHTASGGTSDEGAYSVQKINNNGFVLAGYSRSKDGDVTSHHAQTENADAWLLELNAAGELVKQRTFCGSGDQPRFYLFET